MILNKRQLKIAIPCWITLALIAYFGPIHNLMNQPERMLEGPELWQFTNFDDKTIVIYPIFTEYAYSKNGFYDYYHGICDISCLNVTISRNGSNYEKLRTDINSTYWIHPQEETSNTAMRVLTELNYHWVTDIDIDKDPGILSKYHRIILLHNEYVTEKEFSAINNKTNVIYLYPNALYAKVNVNYKTDTMILIKGHGYKHILNAFDSGTHSIGEHLIHCKDPFWYKLKNGIEYSCYPELDLLNNKHLLYTLQTYPIDTSFNTTKS